jgi:hypothetical protein
MAGRRFTDIGVSKQVNVSSSGHYSFDVSFAESGRRKSYLWFVGDTYLIRKSVTGVPTRNVPQYVLTALEREARRHFLNGDLKVYEYDRDGIKRYTDLRYHDPERFAAMLGAKVERQDEQDERVPAQA